VLSPAIGVARSTLEGRAMTMRATSLPRFKSIDPHKQTRRRAKERAQIVPGAHYGLFAITYSNLVEIASSESAPAELYDLMLEQRDWSAKSKQRALGELLSVAPVRVEA
jgi:hypothetical protein